MISIIIPTFNRDDLLSNCLRLLFSENGPISSECEVIVTDDSTNNITKKIVEEFYPFSKWVRGPKRGPAANRNNGAKMAKGEWLLFLDDDCLPQKGWLSSYMNAIKSFENELVFEGSTAPDREKKRFDEESIINLNGSKFFACNFAIRKLFFEQLNGFDERFPFAAMEDTDFYKRLSNKTRTIFLNQALVIHPWRRIKPYKSFQKHWKSHQLFAEKHELVNFDFRWNRAKIFIGRMLSGFVQLKSFSFRGWNVYIEKCILNFCLIFI